jgi:hypothetical protein
MILNFRGGAEKLVGNIKSKTVQIPPDPSKKRELFNAFFIGLRFLIIMLLICLYSYSYALSTNGLD